jgi:sugar/nucleoside kinase (ribokinase family)
MKRYDAIALGELNADLIMTGLPSMPVPGRELLGDRCQLVLGSSTAICACVMGSMGLKTAFLGKLGLDAYGGVVERYLNKYSVDDALITRDAAYETGITVAMSAVNSKDRAMITYFGDTIDCWQAEEINAHDLASTCRHLHVGSFFLQSKLRPGLAGLFAELRGLGVTTSLDAGWDDTGCWDYGLKDVLAHTTVFFPNEPEAMAATGKAGIESAAKELARYCDIAVVKMGPQGAYLHSGDTGFGMGTYDAHVADTTGAGDSFNAGFLYAYLNGMALRDCMAYGNAAGSVSVTRMGGTSACPTLAEVERTIALGKVVDV